MRKNYYQIDGVNEMFHTLKEAKFHVYVAYTDKERAKYLRDKNICKVVNGETSTVTPILVDESGKYKFCKTRYFQSR